MKSKLIPLLLANLLGVSCAFAADGDDAFKVTGSVGVGGISTSVNGSTSDAAKLHEYRDLGEGVLGTFDIKGRSRNYYLDAYGENLGRDDMSMEFKGGKYGVFKYQLFDDRIVHNWAFGARTPYSGIGSDTLTATLPNLNVGTWNSFNLQQKRNNAGGMFEMSNNSPWFIRVDANQVNDQGLKLIAGANGTSPGNGFTDKPFPIDTTTQNASVEGGYATKQGQFAVNLSHSKFANNKDTLMWQNGFFGGMDTSWLAADSNYTKIGANGALKQLPLSSTLSGRFTYSKTTNDIPIATTVLTTGGIFGATNPDASSFKGDVVHKTASLSLHSNPTRSLDTRLYWNKFEKENKSTKVDFLTGSGTGGPIAGLTCGRVTQTTAAGPPAVVSVLNPGDCATETLSYKKDNLGLDVGYRLNAQNRLVAGFDYVKLDRDRIDFNETKDKKLSLEYRNTSLDWLAARVKFQQLERRSNFLEGAAGADANDPEYLNRFIRRFDAANVDQSLIKLVLDANPVERLDLSFEGILKDNKYKDTTLGRTKDTRQEFYASVGYGDMNTFRVMAFADLELIQYDSYHRNISTVSSGNPFTPVNAANAPPSGNCQTSADGTNCYDPNTTPNNSNYNWAATNKDRNWSIGLGADWAATERFKLKASYIVQQTKGTVDFAVQPGATPTTPAVNIGNFDNTRKLSFNLKGTYTFSKTWDVTGGYAWEKYRFDDIAYAGYTNTIGTGTGASYYSGAFGRPEYIANIFYMMGTYKF